MGEVVCELDEAVDVLNTSKFGERLGLYDMNRADHFWTKFEKEATDKLPPGFDMTSLKEVCAGDRLVHIYRNVDKVVVVVHSRPEKGPFGCRHAVVEMPSSYALTQGAELPKAEETPASLPASSEAKPLATVSADSIVSPQASSASWVSRVSGILQVTTIALLIGVGIALLQGQRTLENGFRSFEKSVNDSLRSTGAVIADVSKSLEDKRSNKTSIGFRLQDDRAEFSFQLQRDHELSSVKEVSITITGLKNCQGPILVVQRAGRDSEVGLGFVLRGKNGWEWAPKDGLPRTLIAESEEVRIELAPLSSNPETLEVAVTFDARRDSDLRVSKVRFINQE